MKEKTKTCPTAFLLQTKLLWWHFGMTFNKLFHSFTNCMKTTLQDPIKIVKCFTNCSLSSCCNNFTVAGCCPPNCVKINKLKHRKTGLYLVFLHMALALIYYKEVLQKILKTFESTTSGQLWRGQWHCNGASIIRGSCMALATKQSQIVKGNNNSLDTKE